MSRTQAGFTIRYHITNDMSVDLYRYSYQRDSGFSKTVGFHKQIAHISCNYPKSTDKYIQNIDVTFLKINYDIKRNSSQQNQLSISPGFNRFIDENKFSEKSGKYQNVNTQLKFKPEAGTLYLYPEFPA